MSQAPRQIIAIIPALNESAHLGSVLSTLPGVITKVIVVDDGSTDGTGTLAQKQGAYVIRHEHSQGYDASLNEGFVHAQQLGADIFVTFDADGEHHPEDIAAVLAPILASQADIVVGTRPTLMHAAEKIFALYTTLRFKVADPLCGLKAYTRDVYERVGAFDTVHSIGTELMIRGKRAGFRLMAVPIRRGERVLGDSSRFYCHALRANMKVLSAFMRILPFTL